MDYSKEKGFNNYHSIENGPCMDRSLKSFAVDEKLNVYTCPGNLYRKNVGYISEEGELIITSDEWYRHAIELKSCVDTCKYAPLCYGDVF